MQMNKGDLKAILADADAKGMPDSAGIYYVAGSSNMPITKVAVVELGKFQSGSPDVVVVAPSVSLGPDA